MFCRKCGAENEDTAQNCKCGEPLRSGSAAAGDDAISSIIPYRNVYALVAYYLGVFSVIPCFGFLIGIPALVLGIIGLKHAGKHPEAKGKVHAWVGIILGGFCGLVWLALLAIIIIMAILQAN